jgi:hypothetical protein
MDPNALSFWGLDLGGWRFAEGPQRSGPLTVWPLLGPEHAGRFASPLSGLKLEGVKGYGNLTLENSTGAGLAIVPLHIGYIQDQAQNHALCRSAFIGPGQKLLFEDACCVQQAQGGYLEGREQWFFVLPVELREEALKLRGQKSYQKLWRSISALNERYGMEGKGHLEQIVCRERAYLTQFASRFELTPGQTGALFFFGDVLAGVELAPSAEYFAEVFTALICFCYGPLAMRRERARSKEQRSAPAPFAAATLPELRQALSQSRRATQERLLEALRKLPQERFKRQEEERYLKLRLSTLEGQGFLGQVVEEEGKLLYASLTTRARLLE